MDMSVNPDGMDTVDYSDFEYQQTYFHVNIDQDDTSGSPVNAVVNQEIEPLKGMGGLDQNEVAELVYAQLVVNVAHKQATNDQDVGSETLLAGVYGANLPNSQDLLPGGGTDKPDQTVITSENVSDAGLANVGSNTSEGRVFAPFAMNKSPAFDDQTNGPGGAGNVSPLVIERPFRQMVGRGPVLDASDDINCTMQIMQSDEIVDSEAQVNIHQVWDTAEVSDAGRAFSVPK